MPAGRILVVDDDRMVRDTLGRVLEQEGYDVAFGRDGNEALAHVETSAPDVILLDLMMPGMNGRQFLTALRDRGITEIPVVVMTAVHGLNTHQALSLGACDVIEKPFDMESMLNKVALAVFRTRRDLPAMPTEPELGDDDSDQDHDPIHADGVVVIVDDDRAEATRLDGVLADNGFTTVCVGRTTEDLARLVRVLEPRAIVLGLGADPDDLAALRTLRADSALHRVPVLVVSPSADLLASMGDELSALSAAVLLKPLRDEALLGFVTQPPEHARHNPSDGTER